PRRCRCGISIAPRHVPRAPPIRLRWWWRVPSRDWVSSRCAVMHSFNDRDFTAAVRSTVEPARRRWLGTLAKAARMACIGGALALAGAPAHAAEMNLSPLPLYLSPSVAPLNMLVVGRDHKLYY